MDESDITKAVFEPSLRPSLRAALMADPVLLGKARDRHANLAKMHQIGQVFDRDHISKMTYEMLGRMLAQVDAAKQEPPEVTVS